MRERRFRIAVAVLRIAKIALVCGTLNSRALCTVGFVRRAQFGVTTSGGDCPRIAIKSRAGCMS